MKEINPYSVKAAVVEGERVKLVYNNGTECLVDMSTLVELINHQ